MRLFDLMMAAAGFVHSNGVGIMFHDRMYAAMCSRSAFFEGNPVVESDCFPRIPKDPSTWFSQDAVVGVKWKRT